MSPTITETRTVSAAILGPTARIVFQRVHNVKQGKADPFSPSDARDVYLEARVGSGDSQWPQGGMWTLRLLFKG